VLFPYQLYYIYTMNIFHTYRLGNVGMTTTRKPLRKIGISHNFFIVAYVVSFICLKPREHTKKNVYLF